MGGSPKPRSCRARELARRDAKENAPEEKVFAKSVSIGVTGKLGEADTAGYSYRRATIGSTRDARRAGRNAASSAIATKEMVAPINSEMSVGLMP